MTYETLQKTKEYLKKKDRMIMDWMIILAILFHLVLLYLIIPDIQATRKWSKTRNDFMELNRYKPPPPPPEEKKEEKKKKKKKKVLAKPIPEPEMDKSEPVVIDEETEIVYDTDELDEEDIEAPPSEPVRVGGDVKAPKCIKRVNPKYPDVARRAHIQGFVILEAVITKDGDVRDVKVVKSLISYCDEAAIEAVKQWKFEPGTQNDTPIDVIMNLTVVFKLS